MKLKVHPLAAKYPDMPPSEYAELKASIEEVGVDNPVVVLNGEIVEGRHRNRACEELGMKTPTVPYVGDTTPEAIAAYIWRQNGLRRHLSPSQRAMLAAELANTTVGRPSEENRQDCLISQGAAAKTVGVSERSVKSAAKVLREATPEVVEAVKQGVATVADAAAVATKPKATQRKAVNRVKQGKAKTLKAASEPHERNGKQKNDPRMFERWKSQIGAVRRAVDTYHRDAPAPKFHRVSVERLNAVIDSFNDWQRAVR